jgi:hypothetical protein
MAKFTGPTPGDAVADHRVLTWLTDELRAVLVLLLATKMMTHDRDIVRALDAAEARVSAANAALEAWRAMSEGVQ